MRARLGVEHADVDPAALVWGLDLPVQPALAVLELVVAGVDVEIRLLGASHQVIARGDGFVCSETVACGLDRAAPLPAAATHPVGRASYRLSSEVVRLDSAAMTAYVAGLDEALGGRSDALVGIFPAPASAITAVVVEETATGVRWRSWHAYPEVGTIVATSAAVDVP